MRTRSTPGLCARPDRRGPTRPARSCPDFRLCVRTRSFGGVGAFAVRKSLIGERAVARGQRLCHRVVSLGLYRRVWITIQRRAAMSSSGHAAVVRERLSHLRHVPTAPVTSKHAFDHLSDAGRRVGSGGSTQSRAPKHGLASAGDPFVRWGVCGRYEGQRRTRPNVVEHLPRGRDMRTLHAYRSPLRSRYADARARLAVLRAEVADILRTFPELRADMARRPQRTPTRSAPPPDTGPHHPGRTGGRHTAH